MSYHGLGQLVYNVDVSQMMAPVGDWRAALKLAASAGANAISAIPARERLDSPRAADWAALQRRFVDVAARTATPNTETDPARRLFAEELLRSSLKTKLGAGVPSTAPTLQSTTQWAREAAPAVDVVRAKYQAALAVFAPPPPPPPPAQQQIAFTPFSAGPAKTFTTKTPPPPSSLIEPPKEPPPPPPPPVAEKERYAPPSIPTVDTVTDLFAPPAVPQTPATPEAPPATTQVPRPGLLGVPWLWWGLGGGVVLLGGGYAAYRGRQVTPNRRRGTKRNARRKISAVEAKRQLRARGVDFSEDYHALPSSSVDEILKMAKSSGYRKRKDAPGSTARMYFYHLARTKG